MPLSGVAIISWKTRPAFSTRPMSSSRSDAKAGRTTARLATEIINTFLYIRFSPYFPCSFRLKALVTLCVPDYRAPASTGCSRFPRRAF